VLRQRAEPVDPGDAGVQAVARRMIELMHEARGVGLAAPQVGLAWRLFVANVTGEPGEDRVFMNPELFDPAEELETRSEGCLSLPKLTCEVRRPIAIRIRATGLDGELFELQSDGLPARVWQHENDHLDGVLIIDKQSRMDRLANRRALKELEAAGG
jgi:peptide deformylase